MGRRQLMRPLLQAGAAAILTYLTLGSLAVGIAAVMNDAAVNAVRDTDMGWTVPIGSLVLSPDGPGWDEGDVVAYYVEWWANDAYAGSATVTPRVVASGSDVLVRADATGMTARIHSGQIRGGAVATIIPVLGFAWWFGSVGFGMLVLLLLSVAYATLPVDSHPRPLLGRPATVYSVMTRIAVALFGLIIAATSLERGTTKLLDCVAIECAALPLFGAVGLSALGLATFCLVAAWWVHQS